MDPHESNDTGDSGAVTDPHSVANPRSSFLKSDSSRVRWSRILLLILIFLVVALQRWKSGRETPDPPAVNLNESHSLVARAIQHARDAVIAQPQSATVWGHYGMCLYSHEFTSAAIDCFEQAETLDADDYRWPYLRGICVTFIDPEEGLVFFERSVRLRPDLVFVRMRAAELSIDLNRQDQARAHISMALNREPQNARVTLAAARLALLSGDLDVAWQNAVKSNRANPDIRGTYELLARICFQRKDGDAAKMYLNLMQDATRTDDWPDPLLSHVMEMRRDLNWVIFQVQRQLDDGRTDAAMATLYQMTTEFPQSVELRIELIRALLGVKDYPEAGRILGESLQVQPTSSRLHRMQGLLHYQQGEKKKALEAFSRAIRLKPNYSLAHYNVGRCLLDLGDKDRALRSLQLAFDLQPDLPGLKDDLARLENPEPNVMQRGGR
ncbi:MAG: tetratricopeptide repeat protein [Fuerstiella sp.]